jgi:glycosyltransferase involved in cell wall biosynthesis
MNALIYSPGLAGHLQVYCRVIARALLDAGHTVVIASPSDAMDWRTRWPVLRPLVNEKRVECVDVRRATGDPSGALTAEQLIQIQRECRAETTLFVDADMFAAQFRRIAAGEAPRLRGRVCAIFARTSEWCPGEEAYAGRRNIRVGPALRDALGRIKRSIFNRRESIRYFFEHVLVDRRTVDAIVVKDERILHRYGPPVFWMPEIYRVFDVRPAERRQTDWDRFSEPVRRYIERAGSDRLLLYFGTGAWYKGYDLFLELARRDGKSFALHAGAPDRGEKGKRYGYDVEGIRRELLAQERLFESGAFIESDDLASLLFTGIARFVSTHRLTLSSGTVLQALDMGKSVLTTDAGLVGWRTREFKLGGTYAHGDMEDLEGKWSAFKSGAFDADPRDIRTFMDRFSRERVEQFFVNLMAGASE